jgi:hypothetical protein
MWLVASFRPLHALRVNVAVGAPRLTTCSPVGRSLQPRELIECDLPQKQGGAFGGALVGCGVRLHFICTTDVRDSPPPGAAGASAGPPPLATNGGNSNSSTPAPSSGSGGADVTAGAGGQNATSAPQPAAPQPAPRSSTNSSPPGENTPADGTGQDADSTSDDDGGPAGSASQVTTTSTGPDAAGRQERFHVPAIPCGAVDPAAVLTASTPSLPHKHNCNACFAA